MRDVRLLWVWLVLVLHNLGCRVLLSLLRGWSYMIKPVTLMDRGNDSRVGSVLPISQLLRLKVMNKRTAKMRKMSKVFDDMLCEICVSYSCYL